MSRILRFFVPLLVLSMLGSSLGAQELRVVTRDSTSNRTLRSALVVVLDQHADIVMIAATDRKGRAAFELEGAGYYALRVSSPGYGTHISSWIPVGVGDTLEVTVKLPPSTVTLDPMVITARQDSMARYLATKVNAFATGVRIIPPSLLARHADAAPDYVSLIGSLGVPGLQTITWPDPNNPTRLQSCIASGRRGGGTEGGSQSCLLVFLNDIRLEDPDRIKMVLAPSELGYAIYIRAGEAGLAYGTGSQNGVLLLYTKERLKPER